MKIDLKSLKREFENELTGNILNYWMEVAYDSKRKSFFGRITNEGEKFPEEPLSAVLITRIMWTFSATYRIFSKSEYKKMADEAFRILLENFWDQENGGIFWSVYPDGKPEDRKKQFYAEAFFIYALSEYYLAFKDEKAKQIATSMFMLMEGYAFDIKNGGYIEATTADWKATDDRRLSPPEVGIKKSMNTHLHILEAYTNLYRISKEAQVRNRLEHLIHVFLEKILDKETAHLNLFFDSDWTVRSHIDSYGHDIEASWLLCEAAETLGDKSIIREVEAVALKMAEVTLKEGLARHGGMYYEKDGMNLRDQFSWWPQTESVIGFFNAWQVSGEEKFFQQSQKSWEFIKKYLIDKNNGEWFAGVNNDLKPMNADKVGPWKAPYHNSRMCLEMMHRIGKTDDSV